MEFTRTLTARTRVGLMLAFMTFLSACGGGGSGGGDDILIGGSPRGATPDIARADAAFEGTHHSGSDSCTSCHNDSSMTINTPVPGVTRNVSIGTAWETSVMANSARDPYWHAVVASELHQFPMLEDTINDKCTVCHAPMANDFAKKEGLDLRLFDKGEVGAIDFQPGIYSMNEENELFNHAMDGVSCSLCHQMEDVNFGNDESMTGGYTILGSPTGDVADRPAYGQYTDPDVGYMRQQAGFLPQYGPHLSTSESCATCHNLNLQPVNSNGETVEGVDHFAEQAIYTEWLKSDYATGGPKEASCQDCHMPVVDEEVFIGQGAPEKREDFAEHVFLGANTVMQDMFKNFSDELGIKPGLDFDGAIARNREFLTTSADVTISQGAVSDGTLSFDVNIQNNTGHKLPGGYHSRRVYLHVLVLDASGQQVFESGRINANGSIVGVSEDSSPASWEQHYDVITSPTQVQVYQSIVGDINGDRTHSLLDGSQFLKDNRLLPSGFNRFAIQNDPSLPDSFGTFGKAVEDPDFLGGGDTVTYRIPVEISGSYTVSAELRYQPFSFGHLKQLFTEGSEIEQVDMFRTIYDATTLRDEVIDTATETIQ
ncbi:MAG: hypothetical protein AB8B84_03235 [Granulosicoccus sp.]